MRLSTIYFLIIFLIGCNNIDQTNSTHKLRTYEQTTSKQDKYYLLSEIVDLDADGYIDQVYIYTYDQQFNLIKKEFEFILNKHYVYRAYLYQYDKNFNKTKEVIKDQFGNILSQSDFEYDNNFNLINIAVDVDSDFMVDNIYYFQYDLNSTLIQKEYDHGANGFVDYISKFIYDTDKTLIQEILYKADDTNFTMTTFYIYDQNNNLIKQEQHINNKVEYSILYTYDKNNLLIHKFYSSKNIQSFFKYFYDQNNNLIKQEQYDKNGTLKTITTYEWIKRV